MIVTLFQQQSEAVKGSCIELCGHLKSRMTLSEALFLTKCFMNHLTNESVLMYYDLRFVYTSEPGGKPSANSCVLLTSLNIRTGGGGGQNCLSALQHAITVMFSLFSPDVKT